MLRDIGAVNPRSMTEKHFSNHITVMPACFVLGPKLVKINPTYYTETLHYCWYLPNREK